MTLEQFLTLFRGATTPEARSALIAGLTAEQKRTLVQSAIARAQELRALDTRSVDQEADMALSLDAADLLRDAVVADNASAARFNALEDFNTCVASNPALVTVTARSDAGAPGPGAGVPQMTRIGNFDLNSREARAIVGDLEAYRLSDNQIRHLNSPEYRNAFMAYIRSCGGNPQGTMTRALNEVTIDGGGAVVPLDMVAEIIQRRAATKRVSSMVRRFQTSRDELKVPKTNMGSGAQINDLAVQWVGAEGTVTEDTTLEQHGSVSIKIHRGGILIVADRAWLEDAAFDMEGWIVEQIADMYEAMLDSIIVSGSGNGRPYGLTTRTGTTTAADNLITAVNIGDPVDPTGLMNIIGNLDAQYATNAEWLIKRTVLFSQIISLRDAAGGFLFGTQMATDGGAKARVENQLIGYGVTQSDHMAAAGAGAKIAYFGDFKQGYGLVERVTLQIEPYLDPAIQKKDQRGWYVRFRLGGDVLADWALRCGLNTDV